MKLNLHSHGWGAGWYKWLVIGMLWFVCFLNYADRQAIFSVFPLIKQQLHSGVERPALRPDLLAEMIFDQAMALFVVFSQGKPHLSIFIRPQ